MLLPRSTRFGNSLTQKMFKDMTTPKRKGVVNNTEPKSKADLIVMFLYKGDAIAAEEKTKKTET